MKGVTIPLRGDPVVSSRVKSSTDFERAITATRLFLTNEANGSTRRADFLDSMYYLLGWMVGDAERGMGSPRLKTVRVRYELSKKHPENLGLGEFIARIIRVLEFHALG